MKKLLICSVLLAGCSTYADPSGFYLGGGLGWSDAQYTDTLKEEGLEDFSTDLAGYGPAASLFGGYRLDLNSSLFAALETNAQLSTAKFEQSVDGDETLVEQTSSFGVAALMGTQVGAGEIYGRIGFQLANYNYSETETGFPEDDIKTDTSHSGIRFGLGTEFPLGNHSQLRMDWSRTLYSEEQYEEDKESDSASLLEPTETLFQIGFVRQF